MRKRRKGQFIITMAKSDFALMSFAYLLSGALLLLMFIGQFLIRNDVDDTLKVTIPGFLFAAVLGIFAYKYWQRRSETDVKMTPKRRVLTHLMWVIPVFIVGIVMFVAGNAVISNANGYWAEIVNYWDVLYELDINAVNKTLEMLEKTVQQYLKIGTGFRQAGLVLSQASVVLSLPALMRCFILAKNNMKHVEE